MYISWLVKLLLYDGSVRITHNVICVILCNKSVFKQLKVSSLVVSSLLFVKLPSNISCRICVIAQELYIIFTLSARLHNVSLTQWNATFINLVGAPGSGRDGWLNKPLTECNLSIRPPSCPQSAAATYSHWLRYFFLFTNLTAACQTTPKVWTTHARKCGCTRKQEGLWFKFIFFFCPTEIWPSGGSFISVKVCKCWPNF